MIYSGSLPEKRDERVPGQQSDRPNGRPAVVGPVGPEAKPAYWYFMTGTWIALGAILYLAPWVI